MPQSTKTESHDYWAINYAAHLNPNGTRTVLTNTSRKVNICSYTKVLNNNPNWKVTKAKRLNASSVYTTYGFERYPTLPLYTAYFKIPGPSGSFTTTEFRSNEWFTPDALTMRGNTNYDDAANARLKRKLSDKIGNMNALLPLIESRELRKTIRGAAELTEDLLKTLITIKRTKGRSAFQWASKAWLTWSFGISPLVSDTQNLVTSIGDYLSRQDAATRLTGTFGGDQKRGYTTLTDTASSAVKVRTQVDVIDRISYRYIAGYDLNIKSANDYSMAEHLGFKPQSLISTGWELMAFSWVIDYFTTAGAYLEDLWTSNPSKNIYLCRAHKCTSVYSIRSEFVGVNAGYGIPTPIYNTPALQTFDFYGFQRTLPTSLPNRILRFKTFDEIGVNSVNRVLNLASVFIGSKKVNYVPGESRNRDFYHGPGV